MVTQQQLISSLLTQPPVEVNAVGLILQIGCQRRLVMAQVSTNKVSIGLRGDFCL